MAQQPVLELGELLPENRRLVRLYGVDCYFREATEFSLIESHRLQGLGKRFIEFGAIDTDDLDEATVQQITVTHDGLVKLIVDGMTSELLAKLSDGQKSEIIRVFTRADEPKPPPATPTTNKTRRTGATPSRDAKGSMAATPTTPG